MEGQCHQVPRLRSKTKVDVTKCHTCLAKSRDAPGDPAPPSAPPEPAQCPKCHACDAKRRWMSPSATPATRNKGGCHHVPRLPRKVAMRPGRPSAPKRATRASPVLQAPRLPCETKADVAKCHACNAGWQGVNTQPNACERLCVTKLCVTKLYVTKVSEVV